MLKDMYSRSIKLINDISRNRDSSLNFPLIATREIHQFLSASLTCMFEVEGQNELCLFTASSKLDTALEREITELLAEYVSYVSKDAVEVKKGLKLKHEAFSRCLIIPFVHSLHKSYLLFSFDYTLNNIDSPEGLEILNTLRNICVINMKNKLLIEEQALSIKKMAENERDARRHQFYFKQLFDNMSNGVAIYTPVEDEDGQNFIFKDYNRAGEKLDGQKKEDILGRKVTDVFPGVKDFGLFEVFLEVNKTGQSRRLPVSLYNADSLIAWRENEVIKLPDGSIVAIYSDHTSQKLAEEKAKRYSRYARALIENSPHPMLIFNAKKEIEYVNRAFETVTGYSQEECAGMLSHFPWIPKELYQKTMNLFDETYNGKRVHTEMRFNSKKGIPFWVDMYNMPIQFSEDTVMYICYWVDITERKYAEVSLKSSEENKKKILDAIVSGLFIYDFEKHTNEYINPAYTKITGWSPDEINAMGSHYYNLFHKDDEELRTSHITAIKNSELDFVQTVEYRFRTKHEGWKWLLSYDIPFERDLTGKVRKFLGSFVDVTERRKMEKALVESERKAKEANRAKSEFIANMSHEIRTPLNGVIGFTDLLMTTSLSEDQEQYIKNIQNSSIVLMDLINDILDFSKIEAGKLELEDEGFNLPEMLKRAVEVIRLKAQEKELELLFDYSPEAPVWVYGDSVRLRQVILNFLGNAVKFTEEGEIELAVELIGKSEKDNNVRMRFTVRDTGIGIPEGKQHAIMEEFSQADNSITRRYGGTGLGLAISKKIIEKMGSEMIIESEIGRGSSFSFELNLHYLDTVECSSDSIQISNVLVVDDNMKNLEILEKIFKHWGIVVEKAVNGFEALQKTEKMRNELDLIVMDYSMPYMSGIETIEKMRSELEMTVEHKPMIILYSSIDTEKIVEHDVEDFIDKKIMKPITMNELFNVLSECPRKRPVKERENVFQIHSGTILIVEDNELNRDLMKKYLNKLGDFSIFEAEDGKQAIDLYARHKNELDLIFMDIQMPEVDGYHASREIRMIEPEDSQLKIIALTARILKGEEKKVKEAGMNDFLSKPLRLNTLKGILNTYLLEKNQPRYEEISMFLKEMLLTDSEIEDMINEYIVNLRRNLSALTQALEKGDFNQIELLSHTLKGTCANVGNMSVSDYFKTINDMMKDEDFNLLKVHELFDQANQLLNEFDL